MKKTLWIIPVIFVTLVFSCSLTQPAKNPIFSGSTFIENCSPTGTTNAVFPDFKWNSPGSSVIYEIVALFNSPIVVDGSKKTIVNTNACIAMWTTGMTGSAGSVNFQNFKKVTNGVVLTTTAVDGQTLTNNGSTATYYWAVWAFNNDWEISHSSGQNQLTKN